MSIENHASKSVRAWRYALAALVVILLLTCSVWYYAFQRALDEREAEAKALRAKGHPVWWPQVVEAELAAPDGETGAALFLKAVTTLKGESNRTGIAVPTEASIKLVEDRKFAPIADPTIQQELKIGRSALDLLEKAVRLKPGLLTTQLDSEQPASILLPHIQDSRRLTRLLWLDLVDALGRNDPQRAYRAVETSFGASEQLAREPIVISQVVRVAMFGEACRQMMVLLAHHALDDAQFRNLDSLLAKMDRDFSLEHAVRVDSAMMIQTINDPDTAAKAFGMVGSGSTPGSEGVVEWLRVKLTFSPLMRQRFVEAQTTLMKYYDIVAGLADVPPPWPAEKVALAESLYRSLPHDVFGKGKLFFNNLLPTQGGVVSRFHQQAALTRLAMRVVRFKQKTGAYPKQLNEVCDAEMPELPRTWFQGMDPGYLAKPGGFELFVPEKCIIGERYEKVRWVFP